MPMRLNEFSDVGLTPDLLDHLLDDHHRRTAPALRRLWDYYRNPITPAPTAPRRGPCARELAQAAGLPERLRGRRHPLADDRAPGPDVVIENDIAWRLDALVDFVFGTPPVIESQARDPRLRRDIESALRAMLDEAGGVRFMQDAALLGSVHGWVDLVLDASALLSAPRRADLRPDDGARRLRALIVEAPRAIPVLDPGDYRAINALVIRSPRQTHAAQRDTWPTRAARAVLDTLAPHSGAPSAGRHVADVIEIWSPRHHAVWIDQRLVLNEPNRLGVLPVVHIQNSAQPFAYAGLSDVEPLIPLQDELNTRLSDRAHRVTMQSFNMYLMKGLDLTGAPAVGPGQVWSTDNPDASVQAFGGDAASPSEDRHIEQVREAMDKTSGVSPVVLGVIRERLGHLSSENALRITLMGILNKTQRKRAAYGAGLQRLFELALHALDVAGVLPTDTADRAVTLKWTDPLPVDEAERLRAAAIKRDLGVPADVLLRELGYATPATPATPTTNPRQGD